VFGVKDALIVDFAPGREPGTLIANFDTVMKRAGG
jgi:hypothetical protein